MSELLREYVNLLLEKIRSKGFELNHFKQLDSLQGMLDYAEATLKELGQGSSRIVYTLTSKRVLKLAYNEKGLAQNKAEIDIFTNPKTKPIVAQIFDYDPDFFWLVSELVVPFEDESGEADRFLGLGKNSLYFEEFVNTAATGGFDYIERYGAGEHMELAKMINSLYEDNDLMRGDLRKESSWGRSASGKLVLVDYGFTSEVSDTHYS